jgi:hypothetical protein
VERILRMLYRSCWFKSNCLFEFFFPGTVVEMYWGELVGGGRGGFRKSSSLTEVLR